MPIKLLRNESRWVIRLEGRLALASAAELKDLLIDWLAGGKNLELDLNDAGEIDVAIMQLLWAAAREAERAGVEITGCASPAAAGAIRECGFPPLPGFTASGEP